MERIEDKSVVAVECPACGAAIRVGEVGETRLRSRCDVCGALIEVATNRGAMATQWVPETWARDGTGERRFDEEPLLVGALRRVAFSERRSHERSPRQLGWR